ncbi:MAG: deoxyribonuclease IV [Chloroflexota bacterium]|nr:deoxyribonuclease IV [Chloroflexota bacterium]
MLPDGRRIGVHLALADGLVTAADRAAAIGASAIQIFSDNPTAYRHRTGPSPELGPFRDRLTAHGIESLAIHGSYLINPAASDDVLHERSIELLTSELVVARTLRARFVNIHIGSHRGAGLEAGIEAGIARLVAAIQRALTDSARDDATAAPEGDGPVITLENSPGGGGGLGVDLNELALIAAALDAAGVDRQRVGFCLDTAHAWGAGIDLANPFAIDRFLTDFGARIGLDRLALLHLNDSRSELGSRLDRHEHLGAGRIGAAGLGHLLRHPLLGDVTVILETPGMDVGYDAINLARAVALASGEALDVLPPEAFTLRGSRARAASPATAVAAAVPAMARGAASAE